MLYRRIIMNFKMHFQKNRDIRFSLQKYDQRIRKKRIEIRSYFFHLKLLEKSYIILYYLNLHLDK